MKIHLPNSAFLGNIDTFLRSYDNSNPDVLEITAHKKWIAVHPAVLSMVAALGLTVKSLSCERLEAKSKHYLERMGLFKLLRIESGIDIVEHEPAGRFIPITQVKNSENLSKFVKDMIPLLHLEPEHAQPLKYIVTELIRNVIEHADSKDGAIVSAQYYKKSNKIGIGIADAGVGIRETITHSHDASTDLEAIRLALMPGITGTTPVDSGTELNAGAGLFFIKSIAKVNRDFFMMYSGDAMYKLLKTPLSKKPRLYADPFADKHSTQEKLPYWRGTVVGIDMTLDKTEKFTHLLDLIHSTYLNTIRERKKARHRRPRFE